MSDDTAMASPRAASPIYFEFSDFNGLEAALRAVKDLRDISYETLDDIVNAPRGYFSKVLAPQSQRRLTLGSLGWVLGGLGVKCVVVDDPEMLALVRNRMKRRDGSMVRSGTVHFTLSGRHMREIRSRGGTNSRKYMSAAQARQIGKRAARARWAKRNEPGDVA
jgi:hypothetical protein